MEVFYIDDQPVPFEKGEKILSAALRAGLEIPHFCYHPALSVVATCRMCLVDVTDLGNGRPAPKLMTSCSTDAMPNMRISTKNDKVQEGRELVMEYLLVNHPLDCPICDQSGECTLQDHSYAHGTGHSEMEYNKRVYGWRDIGTFVQLERNRCIHCSRCDRFTREITGTDEFGMFNRGHELTLDTFSDRAMTNHFQGNMADICPVGAITEKEFRFKRRAWKLRKVPSVCTGCSTGCNITIDHDRNEVVRLKPRENQDVNQWWMCDEGRLTYQQMNEREQRLAKPMGRVKGKLLQVTWQQLYDAVADRLEALKPNGEQVVALVDTHSTLEEMFLLRRLLQEVFSSDQVFYPQQDWTQPESEFFIETLITTDKAPNQAGARLLGLKGSQEHDVISAMKSAKLLLVLGNPFINEQPLLDLAGTTELMVHIASRQSEWTDRADAIFPGQNHAEKEGSFLNKQEHWQRFWPALRPSRHVRPEWQILSELLHMGTATPVQQTPQFSQIFQQMTSIEHKLFGNLALEKLGESGISLADLRQQSDTLAQTA
ncbi:MAG: molybdopterin-dependent oxidoreductase [bacterium]